MEGREEEEGCLCAVNEDLRIARPTRMMAGMQGRMLKGGRALYGSAASRELLGACHRGHATAGRMPLHATVDATA